MHKQVKITGFLMVLGLLIGGACISRAQTNAVPVAAPMNPAGIVAVMQSAADWALAHPDVMSPPKRKATDWTLATLYAGMMALGEVSTNGTYVREMQRMGETNGWQLGPRKFHADDHC